jgi:hypothetical protein
VAEPHVKRAKNAEPKSNDLSQSGDGNKNDFKMTESANRTTATTTRNRAPPLEEAPFFFVAEPSSQNNEVEALRAKVLQLEAAQILTRNAYENIAGKANSNMQKMK